MSKDNRELIDLLKAEVQLEGVETKCSADFQQKNFEGHIEQFSAKLDAVPTFAVATAVYAADKASAATAIAAISEVQLEGLAANKDLSHITGNFQLGNSKIKVETHRKLTIAAGMAKQGEKAPTRDVIGRLVVSTKTNFGSAVKKVVANIEELAKDKNLV